MENNQGEVVAVPRYNVKVVEKDSGKVLYTREGYGHNSHIDQCLSLIYMQKHYQIFGHQKKGYVLNEIDGENQNNPLDDETFIRLTTIQGKNVIACMVYPEVPFVLGRPSTAATPDYIKEIYDRLDPLYPGIKEEFEGSWISTSNATGLYVALQKAVRDDMYAQISGELLSVCLIKFLYIHGWRGEKIDPPDWNLETILRVPIPAGTSAGFVLARRYEEVATSSNGHKVRLIYNTTGTKREMLDTEQTRLLHIIDDVIRRLEKGEIFPRDVFPLLIAKFAEKPEVRQMSEADKSKVRVFFIVPLLKYLLDTILHTPFFRFIQNRSWIGIGKSWGNGGAEERAQKYHAYAPKGSYKYMWWDCSKLDQSLKASPLLLIAYLSMLFYRPGTLAYMVAMVLLIWSSENTSVKIVKWVGKQFRIIIGTMFSGEKGTSHWDSIYMCLAILSVWITVALRAGMEKELWEDIANGEINFEIYGDDGLMCLPMERWGHLMSIEILHTELKRLWGIELKLPVCGESDSFWSEPNSSGSLAIAGPNFLKRYFVKSQLPFVNDGKVYAVAFRPIEDYFVRIGRSANEIPTPAVEFMRLVGLLYDTQASNRVAWNCLIDAICVLNNLCFDVMSEARKLHSEFKALEQNSEMGDPDAGAKLEKHPISGILKYSKKLGLDEFTPCEVPHYKDIIIKFAPKGYNNFVGDMLKPLHEHFHPSYYPRDV